MDKLYARIAPDGTLILPSGEQELLRHHAGAITEITVVSNLSPRVQTITDTQMLPLGVIIDGMRMRGRFARNEALALLAEGETNTRKAAASNESESEENTVAHKHETETSRTKGADNGMLVETDVIAAFLTGTDEGSVLEHALTMSICYTTFVQLGEVLACIPESDHPDALCALSLLRPLGVPPRYSSELARIMCRFSSTDIGPSLRFAITATIAGQSTLPVLTVRHGVVYSRLDISTINGNTLRL